MTVFALALAGFFFNWFFRGGGIESALLNYRNFPYGKPINILAYGGAAWLLSGSQIVGLSALIGMAIGQAPGWGDFIRAMNGIHPSKSVAWGIMRMTLRCGFWGFCLAAGPVISSLWVDLPDIWLYASAVILAGLSGGVVYYVPIWAWDRFGWKDHRVLNEWTAAEMIHGALLWMPLAILN